MHKEVLTKYRTPVSMWLISLRRAQYTDFNIRPAQVGGDNCFETDLRQFITYLLMIHIMCSFNYLNYLVVCFAFEKKLSPHLRVF